MTHEAIFHFPRRLVPLLSLMVLAMAPSPAAAGPGAPSIGGSYGSLGPDREDPGRLIGVVREGEDGPTIAGASVRVEGPEERTAVSDAEGRFRFELLEPGTYTIRVDHLAYEAVEVEVEVVGDDQTTRAEIRLLPEAIALEPILVEVEGFRRPTFGPLVEVYERVDWQRRLGLGSFITRDEIENRVSGRVSDLLRGMRGVRVGPTGAVSFSRARSFRGCRTAYYVDGVRLREGRLDETVTPMEVEIIEVYRGASQVPAYFGGADAMCGVVAVWTRRGF